MARACEVRHRGLDRDHQVEISITAAVSAKSVSSPERSMTWPPGGA
jgi:hypothetical protein